MAAAAGDAVRSRRAFVDAIQGARRASGAHPRGGGPPPGRRGAAAHRPRPARRRRPPHRPGQRPGRGRRARHGQAPRPGQGGPRPRTGGQPLRAERAARHRRAAAPVRRPGGAHRARPRSAPCSTSWSAPSATPDSRSRWPAPTGRPPLPAAVDLAAYRVIQEALTNVQQARGTRRRRPRSASYGWGRTSRSPSSTTAPGAGRARRGRRTGGGHGLLGMRERVTALGGRCTAGPRYGGGFRVHAILPVRRPARGGPEPPYSGGPRRGNAHDDPIKVPARRRPGAAAQRLPGAGRLRARHGGGRGGVPTARRRCALARASSAPTSC